MRIGVSSYSFHAMVRSGKLTQLSMIQTAAELGFDEIEFTDLQVPAGETPESFAKQLRDECERCGIAMGNYTVTADLLNGSNGDLQAEVERLREALRAIMEMPGEINPSNYDDHDVDALNNAHIETYNICKAALAKKEPVE